MVHLSLRPSNRRVNLVTDLVDGLPTTELGLDDLISLQEALQLGRELVVLSGDQVHVLV